MREKFIVGGEVKEREPEGKTRLGTEAPKFFCGSGSQVPPTGPACNSFTVFRLTFDYKSSIGQSQFLIIFWFVRGYSSRGAITHE